MSTAVATRAERFYARAKVRGARIARAGVLGGEVLLGAALAGVLQGHHTPKGPGDTGPKVGPLPLDFALGSTLVIASMFEVGGARYHEDVGHLGLGFLAGFANDAGHTFGARKRETGHWVAKRAPRELPAGKPTATKAAGQFDPQAMAESLLAARKTPA